MLSNIIVREHFSTFGVAFGISEASITYIQFANSSTASKLIFRNSFAEIAEIPTPYILETFVSVYDVIPNYVHSSESRLLLEWFLLKISDRPHYDSLFEIFSFNNARPSSLPHSDER